MTYDDLTEEDLRIIEERAAAATPAPWESFVEGRDHLAGDNFIRTGGLDDSCPDLYVSHDLKPAPVQDQDFIAHARQDVPRLAAEVRRLRALLAQRPTDSR
jgi:hypothetical protein